MKIKLSFEYRQVPIEIEITEEDKAGHCLDLLPSLINVAMVKIDKILQLKQADQISGIS